MKSISLQPILLSALLAFLACGTSAAEPEFSKHILGNTQIRDLPRSVSGRDFRIMVGLPYSYSTQPRKRYPVLYICDGYWDFTLLNGLYGNLFFDKDAPEFIIVGLSYPGENPKFDSLRNYDYTPVPDLVHDSKGLNTGHGPEFLSSLRNEIIPYVQKEFRVDTTFRALGGSSMGGIFVLYAVFKEPELFQGVIVSSPAIKPFEKWFRSYEAEFYRKGTPLHLRMFLSTASEEWPDFSQAICQFHDTLETRHYEGFALKWRIIDGERHAGSKAESYNRGLRWIFANLSPDPNEK